MVLVETIANPGLYLNDLVTICTAAHAAGALVCVDNTFASPALCRPLDVGADLVLQSAGKLLAGHHDVTAGVVAGSHELIARLRRDAQLFGGTLAPIEAWLAVRGMQTLRQRMAWISHSAARLLPLVLAHPAVTAVRYPGRPTRSAPAATIQQLLPNGAGGLIAIQLGGGQPAADRFTSALRTIPYAATVGGPTTTVSFPPMRHDARRIAGVAPTSGLVRISLGLEEPSELEDEFRYALDAILALNLCSEELVG